MNISYTEIHKNPIAEAALDWVRGEYDITDTTELSIIAKYYNMNMPSYIHHFNYSRNPNHVQATVAWKGILNFLSR